MEIFFAIVIVILIATIATIITVSVKHRNNKVYYDMETYDEIHYPLPLFAVDESANLNCNQKTVSKDDFHVIEPKSDDFENDADNTIFKVQSLFTVYYSEIANAFRDFGKCENLEQELISLLYMLSDLAAKSVNYDRYIVSDGLWFLFDHAFEDAGLNENTIDDRVEFYSEFVRGRKAKVSFARHAQVSEHERTGLFGAIYAFGDVMFYPPYVVNYYDPRIYVFDAHESFRYYVFFENVIFKLFWDYYGQTVELLSQR